MTYKVSYIDVSAAPRNDQPPAGMTRTEDYPTEPAALARARELLESTHCDRVLISDNDGEPVGGVCLQLKLGLTGD